MPTQHNIKNARITLYGAELVAAVKEEYVKRLHAVCEYIKTKVQHNISLPTKELGPSKEGEFPHAITGRLRETIFTDIDEEKLSGIIGSNLCVFDSSTKVVTADNPSKRISEVKVGDLVLTQDGIYREVIGTNRIPAMLKPNLVEFQVAWRSDRNHKLTVTDDHKILVQRLGINRWIAAKDITERDLVYVRKKQANNAGVSKNRKPCLNCGVVKKQIQTNRKFCSVRCRADYWKKNNLNPHTGVKRSDATRRLQSKVTKQRLIDRPETHVNNVLAKLGHKTSCDREVYEWLVDRGRDVETQVPFGRLLVDFYVRSEHTIYEADGAYWHRNQQRDIRRDKEIISACSGVQIVHLHFYDKRFSPKLDANPIPGVHYVACNPGPKSFVDPRTFETKRILSIKKWKYGPETRREGFTNAKLYDLVVEGMHSFVASGIVISNSYSLWLEFGTAGGKIIRPVNKKVLSWIDPVTGERRFAMWVRQGAIKGRSFLRRTLLEERAKIKEMLTKPMPGGRIPNFKFRIGAKNQYG